MAFFGEDSLRRLLKVKVADLKAQRVSVSEHNHIFEEISQVLEQVLAKGDCTSLKQLAVNGSDLQKMGCQGQQVGWMLEKLLDRVLAEPAFNTREELLALAQDLLDQAKEHDQ